MPGFRGSSVANGLDARVGFFLVSDLARTASGLGVANVSFDGYYSDGL